MKSTVGLFVFAVVLVCNEAVSQPKKPGQCPEAERTFGICTYDPNVNCLQDQQCQGAQLCCPNGCNKICKDPVLVGTDAPKKPTDNLPGLNIDNQGPQRPTPPKPNMGTAKDDGPQKPTPPQQGIVIKQCPKSSGSFGICSYDESKNCLGDEQCQNGQMCCSEGCNKVCKEPVTFENKVPAKGPAFEENKSKGPAFEENKSKGPAFQS